MVEAPKGVDLPLAVADRVAQTHNLGVRTGRRVTVDRATVDRATVDRATVDQTAHVTTDHHRAAADRVDRADRADRVVIVVAANQEVIVGRAPVVQVRVIRCLDGSRIWNANSRVSCKNCISYANKSTAAKVVDHSDPIKRDVVPAPVGIVKGARQWFPAETSNHR